MSRVVLDTNVLVSGLLFDGPPGALLHLALVGDLDLVLSSALLSELERVLHRKFPHADAMAWETLAILKDTADLVTPTSRLIVIADDVDDNRVLECALDGRADTMVSGDRHLLALKTFRHIRILSPREYLASLHR